MDNKNTAAEGQETNYDDRELIALVSATIQDPFYLKQTEAERAERALPATKEDRIKLLRRHRVLP